MDYKVCILAAGKGTRNRYALNSNKALLPLGEGTALSYIISKFPSEIEIVIAGGYNAERVIRYALPKWGDRVEFVAVSYQGYGKGPGYSLLQCSPSLQCPFIYICCDTIVTDAIPEPDINWIGVAKVKDKLPYLTLRTEGKLVRQVYDKGDKQATHLASIGLVGVKDYGDFWEGLANPTIVQNEHQDTSGINALIPRKLERRYFNWLDIGTTEGYEETKRRFDKHLSS